MKLLERSTRQYFWLIWTQKLIGRGVKIIASIMKLTRGHLATWNILKYSHEYSFKSTVWIKHTSVLLVVTGIWKIHYPGQQAYFLRWSEKDNNFDLNGFIKNSKGKSLNNFRKLRVRKAIRRML